MSVLGELFIVIVVTISFMAIAFGVFCYKHSKEHKK